MATDLWSFAVDIRNIEGFDVHATDGAIGTIDEAMHEVGSSCVVVDTGPWIFGNKVLIPGSAIQEIDLDKRQVRLRLTKDQIKNSPGFDDASYRERDYRTRVGDYYRAYM